MALQTVQVFVPSCVQEGAVSFQLCLPVAAMGRVSLAPQPEQTRSSSPAVPQVAALVCFQLLQLWTCGGSVVGSVGAGAVGFGSVGFGSVGFGSVG